MRQPLAEGGEARKRGLAEWSQPRPSAFLSQNDAHLLRASTSMSWVRSLSPGDRLSLREDGLLLDLVSTW